MRRYNYRISERRWLHRWEGDEPVNTSSVIYAAALVPEQNRGLGMENARLVILADVFRRYAELSCGHIKLALLGAAPESVKHARALGCIAQQLVQPATAFLVEARDFAHLSRDVTRDATLSCGRLFGAQNLDLQTVLPDVGADALRLALLFLGPPGRDLHFKYENLGSSYRFIQRLWRLAQTVHHKGTVCLSELEALEMRVKERMEQAKPHTALAALFGYINQLKGVDQKTIAKLAQLLYPFTPFIASDIMSDLGVAAGEYDHCRNRDNADSQCDYLSQHKGPN